MNFQEKNAFLDYLNGFISERRLGLFDRIIKQRTRHITVVLEDIFQPQNASAVLRTCDCTGVQDVHIVEDRNKYTLNPDVALGSSKWINMNYYNSETLGDSSENPILATYKTLREKGYRIVATTPHTDDCSLEELPLDQKTALIFGTELNGLTEEAIANADAYVKIPMHGFTESYNISVSAALSLFTLTEKLRRSEIAWQLTPEEELDLRLEWAKKSVKSSEIHEKHFLNKIDHKHLI